MAKNRKKIISMLFQQILILSIFAYALWLLPNNYIEKSQPQRCQPSFQQLTPNISDTYSSINDFASMKYEDGEYSYKVGLENCNAFQQPIFVIETIWLSNITANQINDRNKKVFLKKAKLGGRFYSYELANNKSPISIKLKPIMGLKLNFSIWEKSDYKQAISKLNIYFSLIFSSFITLLLINIIIYLQSRDDDYLRYLPFLISNILFLALSEGVFHTLGWHPSSLATMPLWWLAAMSGYFGIRFIVSFTQMEKYLPFFTKYFVVYPSYLYLVGCLVMFVHTTAGTFLIRLTLLWLTFVPWLAMFRLLKVNNFGIVYVFLAWSALTLGVSARTLYGLNIIELNSLVIYGVVLGSLFETLLLSLSLGYKIVQFREGQQFQLSQALTDVLTELPNRRHLDGTGLELFSDFKETKVSICVAIIDCDKFKDINDNYGHEVGDYVLQVISKKIRTALRGNDIVGRWGGEEFLCFLPDVTEKTVDVVMTRLLDSISEYNIQVEEHSIKTSVSIGLTFLNTNDKSMSDALRRADQALYQAKQQGRACQVKI